MSDADMEPALIELSFGDGMENPSAISTLLSIN
jgi:hypothetical protein